MINNSDMPAMPTMATLNRKEDKFYEAGVGNNEFMLFGLTKREHFAGLAMQGILADHETTGDSEIFAKCAVDIADALLAELERTK